MLESLATDSPVIGVTGQDAERRLAPWRPPASPDRVHDRDTRGIGETRSIALWRYGRSRLAIPATVRSGGDRPELLPKPATAMQAAVPCGAEEHLWSIAVARIVLPLTSTCRRRRTSRDFSTLLGAGIDDWRRVTGDGRPCQSRARLAGARATEPGDRAARTRARPAPRGHPEWADARFLAAGLRHAVMDRPMPRPRARFQLVLGWRCGPPCS